MAIVQHSPGLGNGANNETGSTQIGYEHLWKLRKYLVLLGTLAVSVTYNSGLTPPGGFWYKNKDGHKAGDPALQAEFSKRYEVFFYCNATAFAASLVLIILLLSKSVTRQELWLRLMQFTMLVDLFSLMGAYAAGSCRALKSSIYTWVLVFAVFVYLWIHMLVSTRVVPEKLKKELKKVANQILPKYVFNVGQASSPQEKDTAEARKFILMLVTFAATVTYQAGLSPPGGFWAENDYASGSSPPYKNRPATSVLRSHYLRRYNIFVSCNSTSFVASLVTIILLLSPELSRHGIRSKAVSVCVVADILCLIGAYAAGCSRDLATSLYVMFIIVIVLLCIAVLARIFSYKPVAERLQKINEGTAWYVGKVVRGLSFASHHQDSVHTSVVPPEDSASNQQVPNTTEGESSGEYPPADKDKETSTKEHLPSSWHPSKSENTKDFMSNQENQSTDCQLDVNTKEALLSTEQSSTDDFRTTDIPVEGSSDHNKSRDNLKVDNDAEDIENGHAHTSEDVSDQNSHRKQSEKHLKKTRTCLLLLAILAVSLTYQSGLNPPGGFWSRRENNHSAGDRILEDNNHPRFIAFFYLNAVAFVASFVMILVILSQSLSESFTKRRELQIAMIVDLLSLTGAFVVGSCREAKKSIYISVLVCIVLTYVGFHVLLSIHVIPIHCKNWVSEKLKHFWSALSQLCANETGNIASENELEQELERRHNLLLMLAIVAATVTYQAGINPPGGVWSDDSDVSGTPGNPILQDNNQGRYDVFYYSNSVSFVSSVVITILLVNKESFEHGVKSYALRLCLVLGLLGLLIAYAAGSCRNKIQSIFVIIIAVAVLLSLVIQALLPPMHDTLGKLLDAFVEFLQKWVFLTKKTEPEVSSNSSETSDCDGKNKMHKYLMFIAILAASITYQAGLNPPGGFWSDDNGHVAGDPLLHDINNRRYMTFFCFNSFSFMASIVVIMLLLSKSVRKKSIPIEVLLCLVMILDLLALMIAFAAGSCRKFRTSIYVFVLVADVVIALVFIIFLTSAIAKCLRKLKRSGLCLPRAS